jgi:hypothetical protein
LKRRLWLLNLVLLALVALSAQALKERWREARERERKMKAERMAPLPPLQIAPMPKPAAVPAANYNEVVQKMLFARDRNPNVIVEVKPPPPPKVMPALPFQYGYVDFGNAPSVILAEKVGSPQKRYTPGEKVGDFKLVAVNRTHIMFEWDGQQVLKKMEDLVDKSGAANALATAESSRPTAPVQPAAPAPVVPAPAKPGNSIGAEFKACVAGDSSPNGTVADGMKKIVVQTPFGSSCRWEPVK